MSPATVRSIGLPLAPAPAVPTRLSAAIFHAKVAVHRARRTVRNLVGGAPRLAQIEAADFAVVLAESRSSLWSDSRAAEWRFQLGKVTTCAVPYAHSTACWWRKGRR